LGGDELSGCIEVERLDDGVRIVWIDNPAQKNALNNDLIVQLAEAFVLLSSEESCRVVVLRGRGGVYCAGRNLRDVLELQSCEPSVSAQRYGELRQLNEAIHYCRKPTIAVIETYAFGAGITVASWCDVVLAADDSLISYPELSHGIPPSPAIPALLQSVSRKVAMELILTGRRISAAEAESIGLITRSVKKAELESDLRGLLDSILKGAQGTIERTKEFIWLAEDSSHRAAMGSAVDSISLGVLSQETKNRIEAFFARPKSENPIANKNPD
jgi:enoyl-CoA hydratase/carnithine racemase